jgi:hypothetical protein
MTGKRIIRQPPSSTGQEYNRNMIGSRSRTAAAALNTALNTALKTALATVVTALAVTACSSSGGGRAAHSTASQSAAGRADGNGGSATAAITDAYKTFFSNSSTLAQSVAVLQHGTAFKAALEAEAKSSYAQKSSATVTSVSLVSPDVADVRFTINAGGISLPTTGKAVREGGTWKVAAQTFCSLLSLEGHAPPQCEDSALVSLPS